MSILEKALEYHRQGLNVVPCGVKSKHPISRTELSKWFSNKQTVEDVQALFHNHDGNIGVVCGGVSGNLLVIDCEDTETYKKVSEAIENTTGPTFQVKSHRGGHIYLRMPHGVNHPNRKSKLLEVRAHNYYVLAPDSIHPEGTPYKVDCDAPIFEIRPEDVSKVEEAISAFYSHPENQKSNSEVMEERIERGSRDASQVPYIVDSTLKRYRNESYPSHSEWDMAVVQSLYNARIDYPEIESALADEPDSKYHRELLKNRANARRYLQHTYDTASKRDDSPQAKETVRLAERALAWIDKQPWTGRTGPTDLQVLHRHLQRLKSFKKQPYFLSVREGEGDTGCSRDTFAKATKRLIDAQWLICAGRNSEGTYLYRLGTRFDFLTGTHSVTECSCQVSNIENALNSDLAEGYKTGNYYGVFERQALKKTGWMVWRTLIENGSLTSEDLVSITKMAKPTIKKRLLDLVKYGIVSESEGTYKAKLYSEVNWKQLGDDLDTIRLLESRKRRIQAERKLYREAKVFHQNLHQAIEAAQNGNSGLELTKGSADPHNSDNHDAKASAS